MFIMILHGGQQWLAHRETHLKQMEVSAEELQHTGHSTEPQAIKAILLERNTCKEGRHVHKASQECDIESKQRDRTNRGALSPQSTIGCSKVEIAGPENTIACASNPNSEWLRPKPRICRSQRVQHSIDPSKDAT